jgi:hypothetical protein
MQRRHSNILTSRLEEVLHRGVTHILWEEIYTWYDAERIAIGTWRDIVERWEEVSDEKKHGALRKIEGAGGIFLVREKSLQALI